MISDEDADRLSDIRARDLRVLKPGTWVDEAISDRRFLVEHVAALEARCQEEHELAETQAASAEKGWNRVRELEAALKLGWKVVASDSYDGACDCVTCVPKREFLKTAEKLTAPETPEKPQCRVCGGQHWASAHDPGWSESKIGDK